MLPILCLLLINTVTMTAHPVDRLPEAREERKNSSIMESSLSRYSPRTGEEREEGGGGGKEIEKEERMVGDRDGKKGGDTDGGREGEREGEGEGVENGQGEGEGDGRREIEGGGKEGTVEDKEGKGDGDGDGGKLAEQLVSDEEAEDDYEYYFQDEEGQNFEWLIQNLYYCQNQPNKLKFHPRTLFCCLPLCFSPQKRYPTVSNNAIIPFFMIVCSHVHIMHMDN